MNVFKIPQDTRTLVFDIDGTLYTSDFYVREQVDVQIRHFAALNGMTADQMRKKMADWRADWSKAHGGAAISLGNAFRAFGVTIEQSIQWRNTLLEPERYLSRDERLRGVLLDLSKRFSIACLTNNPVQAARRTLKAIGVDDLVPVVVGLDTCHASKPDDRLLDAVLRLTGSQSDQCLCLGDRYDIDLALPLSRGMGGILVSGVEDVYHLGDLLAAG